MNKYIVVGSINTDLIARVKYFPKPGETLTGTSFITSYGGKGANQAVALSKLGCNVSMIGKVGNDVFGDDYKKEFERLKINTLGIESIDGSTGIAIIEVEESGANHIVLVPGANGLIDKKYIDSKLHIFDNCKVALFQLEIPIASTLYAMQCAKERNIITILDPAPAVSLSDDFYRVTDFITPNETETEILTGISPSSIDNVKIAGKFFLERGVKNVVIKAGKIGAYYISKNESYFMPTYPVKTIDTTAAGDSFNAGLAYAVGENYGIEKSLQFACAVASLSTTGIGAQSAMPDINSVNLILDKYNDVVVTKI